MINLADITSPTLLLNEQKCRANLQKMAQRASEHGLQLAPHFKTHQSASVSLWFRDYGVEAITVTSVKMANYFAKHGWNDITIAMPVNIREIAAINALASQLRLTVLVNSVETARFLRDRATAPLLFYVEVDTGDRRSGVAHDRADEVRAILAAARGSRLRFEGFYTHAGHTYGATSPSEVRQIYQDTRSKLGRLRAVFWADYPNLKLSLGDTPSCSLVDDFSGIDIIRPGNFVYYDLTQHLIGSNTIEEIAICLAVPVVALHPERNEAVTHCGWTYLGKDALPDSRRGAWYGLVVRLSETGWSAPLEGAYVRKLSQEHGVIYLPDQQLASLRVGDLVGILPVHACATVVMVGEATTLDGKTIRTLSSRAFGS